MEKCERQFKNNIGQQQQKTTKTCKNGCMMDVKNFFIA